LVLAEDKIGLLAQLVLFNRHRPEPHLLYLAALPKQLLHVLVLEANRHVPHEDSRLQVLRLFWFGLWRKEDCSGGLGVLFELLELAALLFGKQGR
jgi:hypothetical protein